MIVIQCSPVNIQYLILEFVKPLKNNPLFSHIQGTNQHHPIYLVYKQNKVFPNKVHVSKKSPLHSHPKAFLINKLSLIEVKFMYRNDFVYIFSKKGLNKG